MIGNIVGGAVGGATAALVLRLLEKEASTLGVAYERPVRRYRGYPVDTAGIYDDGTVIFDVGPPNGYGWEILGAMWEINANGGLVPQLSVLRQSDDALILPVFLPDVAAGMMAMYYFMQGASYPMFTVPGVAQGCVLPLPMNGELKEEHITLELAGGGLLDTHRLSIYYEEFRL
jgi:hypothetical protein